MVRQALAWLVQAPASAPVGRTYLVVPAAYAVVAARTSPATATAGRSDLRRVARRCVVASEMIAVRGSCIVLDQWVIRCVRKGFGRQLRRWCNQHARQSQPVIARPCIDLPWSLREAVHEFDDKMTPLHRFPGSLVTRVRVASSQRLTITRRPCCAPCAIHADNETRCLQTRM